jgi:hypothetical protein
LPCCLERIIRSPIGEGVKSTNKSNQVSSATSPFPDRALLDFLSND